MPVGVERRFRGRLAEAGLDDLHVKSRGDEQRCEVVAQVVKPEPFRQSFDLNAGPPEVRLDRVRCNGAPPLPRDDSAGSSLCRVVVELKRELPRNGDGRTRHLGLERFGRVLNPRGDDAAHEVDVNDAER